MIPDPIPLRIDDGWRNVDGLLLVPDDTVAECETSWHRAFIERFDSLLEVRASRQNLQVW